MPRRPRRLPSAASRALRSGLLSLLLVLGAAGAAGAADAQGNFSVRGVGAVQCARAVELADQRSAEVQLLVAWTDGVLTHANRSERETFDLLPFTNQAGLLAAMALNVCRTNGQLIYANAVLQAIEAIRPLRVRQSAAPVTVTVGENSVQIRPETIRLVQTRLRELNLLTANADGQWGAASRAAMRRFQESRNLPVTELPDPDTVIRLVLQR